MQETKKRVLVVDDMYGHRVLCELALQGCDDLELVGVASNGLHGVRMAEELRPDVVVLDLTMPVMDGFEAIPLLRELVPDARIIIWSSQQFSDVGARCRELGAHAFVPKMSSGDEVVAAIRQVLEPHPLLVQQLQHRMRGVRRRVPAAAGRSAAPARQRVTT